jgi:hypothetical protein
LLLPEFHKAASLYRPDQLAESAICKQPTSEGDNGGERALDSPKNIARLNIDHYRRLLATETDPSKRAIIQKLLSEEEAKLRSLEDERKRDSSG